MLIDWAVKVLELPNDYSVRQLKEQYRWFVLTYHPDNQETGDLQEFLKATKAYNILMN